MAYLVKHFDQLLLCYDHGDVDDGKTAIFATFLHSI